MSYAFAETDLIASISRECFQEFCLEFWDTVPGAGKPIWSWHMNVMCSELQAVAERVFRGEPKEHDVVFNVSPGTSKSTICSILFPAWVWTRMPSARILTASHTDALVLDLATKTRWVLKSDRYRACFPEIRLREDQDTKGYFVNQHGGDRKTCTVAGKTPTGFHGHFIIIDDPLDPKKVLSELETKNAREFLTDVIPTRKVDKEVTVTFLIMQRLGMGDPTEVMLEEAKKEGAARVRHICLPSELFKDDNGQRDAANVSPPVLADNYDEDGLMDPLRLNRKVLQEYRARGELYYATQFLQRPYQRGGGMFKDFYFNQRVKAAPYVAKRIRYFDRASTDDGGCYTAGVLMARDQEGNFYVEHVVHGQWEPDERNQRMRATALRDRTRYGPKQEPVIWVEAEGGSSGRDAWKGVARALAGFNVREDRVTGKKEIRAEPWAAQLAAKNVYVVDDGTWDIQNYINEHLAFPLGPYKDQVDASSGAFNLLVGKGRAPTLKIYPFADRSKKGTLRLVICDKDELANLVLEQPALLISISDPLREEVMCHDAGGVHQEVPASAQVNGGRMTALHPPPPLHGMQKLLEHLPLSFADLHPSDYQERYSELIPPYDKPISELVLQAQQAKKLWACLLKKREPPAEIIVLQDDGDRRALSLAYAIVDTLRLPRHAALYKLAEPDWQAKPDDKPPNQFVYDVAKTARSMVL